MTKQEWEAEGTRLFGEDQMQWKFVCPLCKHVQSVQDYKDAGSDPGMVGFSCIGRVIAGSRDVLTDTGHGPCNYAGGGFIRLNPVDVDGMKYFDFYRGDAP